MERTPSIQRPFRDSTRTERLRQDVPRDQKIRMAQIEQKADRIKELAGRQFEASWNRRFNSELGRLQKSHFNKNGPKPPPGSNNESLEARAARNINNRHNQRLRRIETIRDGMHSEGRSLGSGRISVNRFGPRKT